LEIAIFDIPLPLQVLKKAAHEVAVSVVEIETGVKERSVAK
jgi:hypothetical protein